MRSVEENIEALSRAILDDAKAEAEQILAEAKEKAEALRQHAQDQADEECSEIIERARQEADRLRGQAVATTQMKARTQEMEHRERLLDSVFKNVQQQLPSVEQQANYNDIALSLVREAVTQLRSSKVKIRADKRTQSLLTDQVLNEIAKAQNVELSIGEPLESGTGIIAETEDGHLSYDNTLETRLARMQNNLRSSVYRILIGEKI
jgi:vacuolar-type H+-ATPase subunit E/Vma4